MLPARRSQVFLMPTLPVVLAALVTLGIVALRQASSIGGPEFWLMAWTLGFVVGVPLLVIVVAIVGELQRRRPHDAIVPNVGVKIPGAGQ